MNDIHGGEQQENTQMNWFAGVILILGSPLFVLVFMGHHWADIALKVYLCTSAVFGSLLLFIEKRFLGQGWLWTGMMPALFLHGLMMYGLIYLDRAYPQVDRFPVAEYGALVPIVALEVGLFSVIVELSKPSTKS